jgi:hypothetical protein
LTTAPHEGAAMPVPSDRFTRRLPRLGLLVLAGTLLVGACGPREQWAGRASSFGRDTDWVEVDPSQALVGFNLPNPPKVVAVRERHVNEVLFVQEIVLENTTALPGENVLRVAFSFAPTFPWVLVNAGSEEDAARILNMKGGRPTKESLDEAFGALPYEIASYPPHTAYGVYGFAITPPSEPETCVVSWQRVNAEAEILPETMRSLGMRMRYCGQEKQPGEILTLFESIAVNPWTGIRPPVDAVASQWATVPYMAPSGASPILAPPGVDTNDPRSTAPSGRGADYEAASVWTGRGVGMTPSAALSPAPTEPEDTVVEALATDRDEPAPEAVVELAEVAPETTHRGLPTNRQGFPTLEDTPLSALQPRGLDGFTLPSTISRFPIFDLDADFGVQSLPGKVRVE